MRDIIVKIIVRGKIKENKGKIITTTVI